MDQNQPGDMSPLQLPNPRPRKKIGFGGWLVYLFLLFLVSEYVWALLINWLFPTLKSVGIPPIVVILLSLFLGWYSGSFALIPDNDELTKRDRIIVWTGIILCSLAIGFLLVIGGIVYHK